jgi:hypothetical protein
VSPDISIAKKRVISASSNATFLLPLLLRPFDAAARKFEFGVWPVHVLYRPPPTSG